MPGVLEHEEDRQNYSELAAKIKAAYRKEFLKSGRAHGKRQCRCVRLVSMGLAEGKAIKRIADRLNHMCVKNQYRTGTGFLSTWQALNVLSDYGHGDTAYQS